MKKLKFNILNKSLKSMLNKLCVFVFIQIILLSQLAWAGTETIGLTDKLSQDTLSPQILLDGQAFQQACGIYSFWVERVPGTEYSQSDYLSPEAVLAALQAIPEQYRTINHLNQEYSQGGDKPLLKSFYKFSKQLKAKFGFEMESGSVLPEHKQNKNVKYPDARTTYDALMNRSEETRTLKALKLPKARGGDVLLRSAYYQFQDELKEKFKFVLLGADRMKYRTAKSTYDALMALTESQRTAKSLDQAVSAGGNRVLLKAARKFKDQLLKVYGFVLPQEQPDTRRFKTAKEVYDAILARDKDMRNVQSLKAASENGGDWTLLKSYYSFKAEIEKDFNFVLYEGPDSKYPDKQAVEDALLNLAPEDRTSKRLKELRLFNLLNKCYEYGVRLANEPRQKLYNSRQEVIDALEEIPLRDRSAVRLQRKKEQGGNAWLYLNAVEFRVRLPLEEVMSAYSTKESALAGLEKFSDEQRLPSKLARAPHDGGDPMLLLACLEYDIDLPKDKVKYSTKRLVELMLSRYPVNMRTQHMLRLPVEEGGIGDVLLYLRCLEFDIPLEKEPSKFTYSTVEETHKALKALPKEKRTYTQLKKAKIDGGNPTLYKAFKRFREELKQKYSFTLESEPLGKYKSYELTLEALNARAPENRIARKLLAHIDQGGDPGLYDACKRFDILLPEGKRNRSYDTPEAAEAALLKRPVEKRTSTELNKPVDQGGDPSLYKACRHFKIPLPRMIVEKDYPNAKVTFEALMDVNKEDRHVSKLSKPKSQGGNPNLLRAYYAFRAELKRVYKFEMAGTYKVPYPTFESAEQALAKRPKDQRTALALNQPYPQGNRALLNAARKYGIELPKGYMEKFYPDAESVYNALKQRKEKHNTAKMLDRPIGQGGNRTLLIAYHQFRDEIKEKFNYVLYKEYKIGMYLKYSSKEKTLVALNARAVGQRTRKSLMQRKALGGDWALHSACKRFNIPLEEEEIFEGGYAAYRKKVLTVYEGKQIDVVDYWRAMQQIEGLGHERDMIFNSILEYFMPMIFAKAEGGQIAIKVDRQKGFSSNQGFNYDDLVNSAILALIEALDSWHPDITAQEDPDASLDLEEYLVRKINKALKSTKKEIYPNEWREISRDAPYGNKGGNNYNVKSGAFGGGSQRVLDDTLESPVEPIDDALNRFEKMAEVVNWFKNGDYGFIQSAINALDPEDSAQLEFDESLLITKKEKENFKKDLRIYFDKRNIFQLIPGKYSVWLMGSMGNIGLARRGLSDVNILIVSDAELYDLKDAMVQIRRAIGSGIISMGKDNNISLEIGKEHDYHNMIYDSPDLVSLVDRYQLGNAENGIASIEMVSLRDSEIKDNRALHRAQFHLTENLYQMGANASLIAESESGIAEKTKDNFKLSMDMGNHEYLFFMHDYLTGFFEKQVSKVISAHQFAKPLNGKNVLNSQPQENAVNQEKDVNKAKELAVAEYSDLKSDNSGKLLEPEIVWITDSQVELDGTIVNVLRVNGYLSFRLSGVLQKGVGYYKDFWQQTLSGFNGSEIYVDDPEIDVSEIDVSMLVAMEQQTDQLCVLLDKINTNLYAETEDISRRIGNISDYIEVLEIDKEQQRQIVMPTTTADKTLTKKDISFQLEFRLMEQSI